jgi:hypothetical protein
VINAQNVIRAHFGPEHSPAWYAEHTDNTEILALLILIRSDLQDHHHLTCRQVQAGGTCSCWVGPTVAAIDEALILGEYDDLEYEEDEV